MDTFLISAGYKFVRLSQDRLNDFAEKLSALAKDTNLLGLCILGMEGINFTVAGDSKAITEFKNLLNESPEFCGTLFKDSVAQKKPFRRFKIDIRDEIVTLGNPSIFPSDKQHNHLSPQEWDETLKTEKDFVLIDVRNKYETEMGMFKGALDPKTNNFGEFPEFVSKSGIPQEKKILMYCTGGIRCEKAILEMERQGYKNVYQLYGGILNYIAEYPNGEFDGECFVFDHRVSVDTHLNPSSQYKLCPHCGNPGKEHVICGYCDNQTVVCKQCMETPYRHACSKNCAHHLQRSGVRNSL